jgi:outer membrane beta-barrel protein
VGLTLNDAYFQKYDLGAAAVFHFSDNLALGARFDYLIVQTTENVSTAKRELQSRLPVSKPKYGGAADFYWTPIYGKASVFNSIIHFDLFAVAGVGAMISQTSATSSTDPNLVNDPLLNQGPHPAVDLGLGQRYALNELIAFEWTLLETLYTDTPGGTGASQIQRVLTLNAGMSFFLPPVRSE